MQLGKTSILRFMNLEATVLLIHLLFLVYIILSLFLFGVCFIKVLMFALSVQFNFGHKQIPLTLTEIASKLIVALYIPALFNIKCFFESHHCNRVYAVIDY